MRGGELTSLTSSNFFGIKPNFTSFSAASTNEAASDAEEASISASIALIALSLISFFCWHHIDTSESSTLAGKPFFMSFSASEFMSHPGHTNVFFSYTSGLLRIELALYCKIIAKSRL